MERQTGPQKGSRAVRKLAFDHLVGLLVVGLLLGGPGRMSRWGRWGRFRAWRTCAWGRRTIWGRSRGTPSPRRATSGSRSQSWRRRTLQRVPHFEHNLHVVRGATATDTSMQIISRARTNKVVVVPRKELQPAWLWRERPERNREIHQLEGLIAHGYDSRVGIRDTACLVLILAHVVDDILLDILIFCPRRIHWTNQIRLVVFELRVPAVHIYDVIGVIYEEDAVGAIPVDREGLRPAGDGRQVHCLQTQQQNYECGPSRATNRSPAHTTAFSRSYSPSRVPPSSFSSAYS